MAFGWEDRHLYGIRYMSGKGEPRTLTGPPDPETEDYEAEPASGVVLSDLLDPSKPQRSAFDYEYDFGDGWVHHAEVLGAIGLGPGDLICTGGANRGPVEDSGGAGGYRRLVQILADKNHPEHGDASSWLYQLTGDFDSQFVASAFDLRSTNRKLRILSLQWWPRPLTEEERDAVLRPVRWLLEQASPDGVQLTKDGYLKPDLVRRTVEELGWSDSVMGKANREVNVWPVMELRQHLPWRMPGSSRGPVSRFPRSGQGKSTRLSGEPSVACTCWSLKGSACSVHC